MKPKGKEKSVRKYNYEQLNKHINFEREGAKGNARKWATDVICVKCKQKFILPFKPRKPEVYCDSCFKKKNDLIKQNLQKKTC